ncbi:BadF/BadG/BcrA/BcrD ATPase family protein [Sphingomonas sp. HT-1]|uniref:BadF/BadG/BcrA/BcrD ATPase family protein n=1 Tax=unclassified Sphingomonas TaxID=196159 RepID=UPI0002D39371|nr:MULTISPECIES: BadF/BadG/BcrA/BcrD ATPase family protein [unclassified Sphingomonas]KTF68881.1 ATPase [Sphingomonas sp. WG]
MTQFFLGVDAGGSNCRCRLVDAAGRVLATAQAGPANAGLGLESLYATLRDVTAQAVHAAGLDDTQVAGIRAAMGIAGISRPGVLAALEGFGFPFAETLYDTDAGIANLGAHGGGDGAILIIGTGSVAQVRVNGENFRIGGYGFPISDEGSGAALGLSAMRHALRALDGRTRATPLSTAVTERFGHDTARAIAWMDQATPRDYGSFAPLVMAYAEADDAIARSIVEDAVGHIERFIETIFERGATRCALLGGLAPKVRPWLRARTVARLSDPLGDALSGALYLAGLPAPLQEKLQ